MGVKNGKGKVTINIPLTHQDFANLSGLTRETASLELEELEKKKFISYKKHLVTVNNVENFTKEYTVSGLSETSSTSSQKEIIL